jgi:hypothetical protein
MFIQYENNFSKINIENNKLNEDEKNIESYNINSLLTEITLFTNTFITAFLSIQY